MNISFPQQAVSSKIKDDDFHKKTAKAIVNMSNAQPRRNMLKKYYDYYNGNIEPYMSEDYGYVLNPYNNRKKRRDNFPSRMRNYNILKPTIDLLAGEKSKRPLPFNVAALDSESVLAEHNYLNKKKVEAIQTRYVNELVSLGVLPEDAQKEAPEDLEDAMKKASSSYKDNKSIAGSKAVDVIKEEVEYYDQIQEGWFHFLVCGEVVSHKEGVYGDLEYEILNPTYVDYDMGSETRFIEDGSWAIIRRPIQRSTVMDRRRSQLTDEQVERLQNPKGGLIEEFVITERTNNLDSESNLIEEIVVYWKSYARVGFRTYFNEETGGFETDRVDESFTPGPDDTVEWEWETEIRKTIILDGDIFIEMGIVEDGRNDMDNPSKRKLPINGFKYSDINSENISLVHLGIPYQINYNAYKYRMEIAVAKSKDVIGQFDINMIPDKWDTDKFMYYLDAFGIAWVDYNKDGVKLSPQHRTTMDMTIKSLSSYLELLNSVVIEWERLSGITRQRQGEISPYETVSGSRQAIVQSSHVTEDYFRKFERFENRELQGLLDMSQVVWPEGKTARYKLSDGSFDYLIVDGEYSMTNFGVYVTDSGEEKRKVELMETLFQPAVQNGYPLSGVARMMTATNSAEMVQKLQALEEDMKKLQENQQAAAMEGRQQEMQAEAEQEIMKEDREDARQEKDLDVKLAIAEMDFYKDLLKTEEELSLKADEIAKKYGIEAEKMRMQVNSAPIGK